MDYYSVGFLKSNSGKKGEGMPVVRNPQYYFKEGFCWSLINGTRSENDLKFRISSKGINDVGGMSLSSLLLVVPEYYIVCLGNSNFMSRYTEAFVNFTVNFQVNDARQLPIIIPDKITLNKFESLYKQAIQIKKGYSNEEKLDKIQQEIDILVNKLYRI